MVSNSQPLAEHLSTPETLRRARHAGWLAGVAMRLGCGSLARNPYERESEEWLYWETGFEEGLAG